MSTKTISSVTGRMETSRLVIERLTIDDLDFFCEISEDEIIRKYFTSWEDVNNKKDFFIEEILSKQDSGCLFLVIRKKSDLKPIGFLNALSCKGSNWLIEYALSKNYRNLGYMTELLSYICENDFEFLSIFRTNKSIISSLIFEINQDNTASLQVLKKLSLKFNFPLSKGDKFYYLDL